MSEKKFSPFEVSWLFVQEYYTIMNNSPEKLHQFYNKDSYYCNGSEGESSKIYHGQTVIINFIINFIFSYKSFFYCSNKLHWNSVNYFVKVNY